MKEMEEARGEGSGDEVEELHVDVIGESEALEARGEHVEGAGEGEQHVRERDPVGGPREARVASHGGASSWEREERGGGGGARARRCEGVL